MREAASEGCEFLVGTARPAIVANVARGMDGFVIHIHVISLV